MSDSKQKHAGGGLKSGRGSGSSRPFPVTHFPANVVTLGGGTGQRVMVEALLPLPIRLTAIVGVTDNGGHSGVLRKTLGIPQVGDLRNVMEALIPRTHPLKETFTTRHASGKRKGEHEGNRILADEVVRLGSLERAARAILKSVGAEQLALPVSDDVSNICADLEDGQSVEGEWQIIRRRSRSPIRRLFHKPALRTRPSCLRAVRDADLIILCPGTLQTGLLSVLLATGMTRAIGKSGAQVLYVANTMTQPGLTDDWSIHDHLSAIHNVLGEYPDSVLVNTAEPDGRLLRAYRDSGSEWIPAGVTEMSCTVYRRRLLVSPSPQERNRFNRGGPFVGGLHLIRHDPGRLRRFFRRVLSD